MKGQQDASQRDTWAIARGRLNSGRDLYSACAHIDSLKNRWGPLRRYVEDVAAVNLTAAGLAILPREPAFVPFVLVIANLLSVVARGDAFDDRGGGVFGHDLSVPIHEDGEDDVRMGRDERIVLLRLTDALVDADG